MRAVIQRVKSASVAIEGKRTAHIGQGLLILLGVSGQDSSKQAEFLAGKVANLRIFSDENDKMNLSLLDVGGQALVVSNFTLYGDCSHGRRPSYQSAGAPSMAQPLYEEFVDWLRKNKVQNVFTGEFGADMLVELQNDGPVTLILDTDQM